MDFHKDQEGKPEQAQVVNLLVTPSQAEVLSLASNETHIQLVLRNPMDTELSTPPGTILSNLFGGARAPAPSPVERPQITPPELPPVPPKDRGDGGPPSVRRRSIQWRCSHRRQIHAALRGAVRTGLRRGVAIIPAACLIALALPIAGPGQRADGQPPVAGTAASPETNPPTSLMLTVGKSVVIDSPLAIERISVGFGDIAEATATGPRELLLNGKTPGVTSMIVWEEGGARRIFDITVLASHFVADNRVEAIKRQIEQELPGQGVNLTFENETVFLRGTVRDITSADRAVSIASTLGKTVNLLYVDVPPPEAQILLKVKIRERGPQCQHTTGIEYRRARARARDIGTIGTQQFSPPAFSSVPPTSPIAATLSDALNLFLFRSDLNLGSNH